MSWPDLAALCPAAVVPDEAATKPSPERPAEVELSFSEDDLARVIAATAVAWQAQTRERLTADLAAQRTLVLDAVHAELVAALQAQRQAVGIARRQLVDLALAIAGALSGGRHAAAEASARAAIEAALPHLRDEVGIQVAAAPAAVTALRAELPALARACELGAAIDVQADQHLPDGAIRITWSDGWAEHDPDLVLARLASLLDAHRSAGDAAAPTGAMPTNEPIPLKELADGHD